MPFKEIMERNISRIEVFRAIQKGEIIKEYPEDKPFPSYLILGREIKDPLHIVISLKNFKEILDSDLKGGYREGLK